MSNSTNTKKQFLRLKKAMEDKKLLGARGQLCEMTQIGLNVPPAS